MENDEEMERYIQIKIKINELILSSNGRLFIMEPPKEEKIDWKKEGF